MRVQVLTAHGGHLLEAHVYPTLEVMRMFIGNHMPNLRPHPRCQDGIVRHLGTSEPCACFHHQAAAMITGVRAVLLMRAPVLFQ